MVHIALQKGTLAATALTHVKLECRDDHFMNRITARYVSTLWARFECCVKLPRVVCIFDTFDLKPKGTLLPAVMSGAFCDEWQRCGRTRILNVFRTNMSTYFGFVTACK